MQRLIADASKMKDTQKELNLAVKDGDLSFGNIVNAISVTQKKMKIMGTTAKEASTTIEGSLNSLKASWENLLVGIADDNADFDELMNQFIESLIIALGNIMPRVQIIIDGILELFNQMVLKILENLPQIFEAGQEIFFKLIDGISTLVPDISYTVFYIITEFVRNIIESLPTILETGIELFVEFINGIVQSIPELVPVIIDAVALIVETLINNIDLLVDAGIELILALADGLIEALPRLIEKAPEIIQKLYNAFARNFPKIVQAGGELLGKLIAGIVGSFWKLLEVAPQIISNIVNGLRQGWNEIQNVGKYLVQGLWNGISGMGNWIRDKIRSFAHNIINNMKNALGIHSPSRVVRDQIGKMIPRGLAVGIETDTDQAIKSIDLMNDEILSRMKKAVNVETALTNNRGISGNINEILASNTTEFNPTFNCPVEIDGQKAGRILAPYVSQNYRMVGAN